MIDNQNPYSSSNIPDKLGHVISTEDIKWGNMDNYVIHRKIGRGRYSHVFEATDKRTKQKVAVKVLLPIRKDKIKREYQIMESLYHPNVCKLKDIVKSNEMQITSFILEYCPNKDFRELYPILSLNQIKFYMKQLFQGLDYLHSMGIMHRDIKPFNLMIDTEKKKLKIIDFGLSEFYHPEASYSDQVSSLYYRAPELILGETSYDFKIDCWAAGMVLAGMIFKKAPILQGKDLIDQLIKMMKLLGTKNIVQFIREKNLIEKNATSQNKICQDMITAYESGQIIMAPKSDFKEFMNKANKQNCTEQAIDLIEKLLALDSSKRLSAREALNHPFLKN